MNSEILQVTDTVLKALFDFAHIAGESWLYAILLLISIGHLLLRYEHVKVAKRSLELQKIKNTANK